MLSRHAPGLFTALRAHVPSQCAVCRAWPSRPVCDGCVARFAPPTDRCTTCALPVAPGSLQCAVCLRQPPPIDRCVTACSYTWPWNACIGDFKFRGDAGWARAFATLMRSAPWAEPALEQCDLALPMPLSAQRLRERGFNQAYELSRRLAPDRSDPKLLLRVRDTPAQSGLTRAERLRNLEGAFALEPLRAHEIRGRRIVLVDDVMTSGASLFTAAGVLREGGAHHITALVIARTEFAD